MPTLFCCILNCESESVNSKKRKIFYRLPQNSDRKQLWLNQIGDRIKYGTVSSNSRICNLHFATGKPNLDSGHVDYMPTIFPWSTKDEKVKSFKSVEEYESKIKELEQKILAKAFLNASSGSKISQESSTVKFELTDNDLCSKIVIDSDTPADKHRSHKSAPKSEPMEPKPTTMSHSLEPKANGAISGKMPIFKESSTNAYNMSVNVNTQSAIQLVPPDSSGSIKSNLLNYLLSSISRVNMPNNAAIAPTDLAKSLSLNVSAGPLNLSQSYNKLDDGTTKREKINESESTKKESIKKELVSQPDIETGASFPLRKSSFNIARTPDRTTTPSEETTSRSCTCTKSSCLKLYCECFANGNLCCSGCTCINCRNNDRHREERAKIVSSYLERDPWVFSSKIENKDVGKKHSKGCNCLKSSCLKNYCECFENKVFCSSLCRCRMCYNNEEHAQHNNRDDNKIYASSHTSESLSVLSENSPRDLNRKRKQSSIKANNELYEDVSSNESEEEINSKRCQLDSETISIENDKRSNRSINSMEIPPVLPQEDDFTEEELALMVKFREQRTEKPSGMKSECVSPPAQYSQINPNPPGSTSASQPSNLVSASNPIINIPAHLDSNLLLTLSKSLAVANLGLNSLNVVNTTMHDVAKRPSGIDLLSLLATQQLMVSRQSTEAAGINHCISVPQNCNHVIPINLTQMAQPASMAQINQISTSVVSQSRVITTSPTSVTSSISQCKPKLSTEDYVRKHIEAAERAVRADYMRKDNSTYKKPITKQKVKIDPFPLTPKPPVISNIKPATSSVHSDIVRPPVNPTVSTGPMFTKQQSFDEPVIDVNGHASPHNPRVAGGLPSTPVIMTSPAAEPNQCIPNLALYNWISTVSAGPTQIPVSTPVLSVPQLIKPQLVPPDMDMHPTRSMPPLQALTKPSDTSETRSKDRKAAKNKNKSLRQSLQALRSEIRSLKLHMRADQSRLRRLEKHLHILRGQIGK